MLSRSHVLYMFNKIFLIVWAKFWGKKQHWYSSVIKLMSVFLNSVVFTSIITIKSDTYNNNINIYLNQSNFWQFCLVQFMFTEYQIQFSKLYQDKNIVDSWTSCNCVMAIRGLLPSLIQAVSNIPYRRNFVQQIIQKKSLMIATLLKIMTRS